MIDLINKLINNCHNPYFNRWFSAITKVKLQTAVIKVTILILIDGFLQFKGAKSCIGHQDLSQSLF